MSASACEICASIPDFASANLREGERLPDAVLKLVDDCPCPEGFRDTCKEYELTKKRQPRGRLYTYNYYYGVLRRLRGRERLGRTAEGLSARPAAGLGFVTTDGTACVCRITA